MTWKVFSGSVCSTDSSEGDTWLHNLYSIGDFEIISSFKGHTFRSPRLEMLENYFSEPYSVMWQFLRELIHRLFDGAPGPKYLYHYGDQYDHEKIFENVDGLFAHSYRWSRNAVQLPPGLRQ